MEYLPVFLDLRGRLCIVVGGDATAARKTELLLRAGGTVHVLADELDESLRDLEHQGRITRIGGPLTGSSLEGCVMVVIAVQDEALARTTARIASARGIPVNVVDRPALCSCIMPAIVDRSPVLVAISTAGAAPVLGRLLRARLETLLPAGLGRLASLARSLRPKVADTLAPALRRGFWESVLQGPIAELVFDGKDEQALEAMQRQLDGGAAADAHGEIYVVPAPPGGDLELMTLKELRLIQTCDVVFHDATLPLPVLDLIRRDAQRVSVIPSADIEGIVTRIRSLADAGQRVAWLGNPDLMPWQTPPEKSLNTRESCPPR